MLLCVIAEDSPSHKDWTSLPAAEAELCRKKQLSMTKHDQETSAVVDLQPLAEGMPLRITQTINEHRD